MRFSFRKSSIALAGAALIICSCEKHHVGEMPEAQKEHVDLGNNPEKTSAAPEERSTSPSPSATPTPAEFFPETTPR